MTPLVVSRRTRSCSSHPRRNMVMKLVGPRRNPVMKLSAAEEPFMKKLVGRGATRS